MEKQGFMKRTAAPVVITFLVMVCSLMVYHNSWRANSDFIHQALANVSAFLLFFSIAFGPLYIYPTGFFRGAGLLERIAASLTVPVLWGMKEVWRVTLTFSIGESLYFFFNPLIISCFFGCASLMGLSEILCRRAMRKRGEEIIVAPASAVIAMAGGLGFIVFAMAWGMGVHTFYIYQEGYKLLFGLGA